MGLILHKLSGKRRRRIINSIKLVFFPSFCHLCSYLLELSGEKIVCKNCLEKLQPPSSSFCLCCGRYFEAPCEPHICSSCLTARPPFMIHRSGCRYHGIAKDIITLFKYKQYQILGGFLANFLNLGLGKEEALWWDLDMIIPVPLHPKREKQRGFNQAEVIAVELGKKAEIEVLKKILIKRINVSPQTRLSSSDRQQNVAGVFEIIDRKRLAEKNVLLLDDVYTTGATIRECSRVLLKAGVKEVRAVTVAQA